MRWGFAGAVVLAIALGVAWSAWRDAGRATDRAADRVDTARSLLAEAESEFGAVSRPVGAALDALVEALYVAGRGASDETLLHARRAVDVHRAATGAEPPEVATSLSNLGAVLFERGEVRGARDAFDESLRIRRRYPEESLELQESLHNLALATKETGDLAGARLLFEESLDVLGEPSMERTDVRRARAWNDYGLLLHELGDYASALEAFEKARTYAGDERSELVNVLQSLGRLHHDRGDYRAAKAALDEAMTIAEGLPVVLPRWKAALLNNVGWLYHDAGDPATARSRYVESLAVREASAGSSPNAAWTLSNLALLDLSEGRLETVRDGFERALELRRAAYAPAHPLIAHSLSYLALLELVQGSASASLARALEAETIRREGLLRVLPVLEERRGHLMRALEVFGLHSTSLDLALSSLVAEPATGSLVADVWDHVVRSRGLVLDEMAQRARLRSAARDPRTAELAERLSNARQRLANLFVRDGSAELLAAAQRDVEEAEFLFARRAAELGRPDERPDTGWREVRDALAGMAPGTALAAFVEFARFESMRDGQAVVAPFYVAFIVENGSMEARLVPIGSAAEVESAAQRWRRAVLAVPAGGSEDDERAAAAALRRLVWDPLAPAVVGAERVFIVSEGALHGVSFAALRAEGGEFLLERGPLLHQVASEKELAAFADAGSEERSRGSGVLALAADALGDLPHTLAEVAEVIALARAAEALPQDASASSSESDAAVRLLTGIEANEAAFKREAPGRRIVHVATHGFFLDDANDAARDALKERVRGVQVALAGAGDESLESRNPLLLSGIVLARGERTEGAANVDRDDGILLAEEIVTLDLRGVEWAVLSACETGLGTVRTGEGILGLRRAFRLAGAASVIFSLWRVDDEATRDWMRFLYRARFEERLGTAESVRKASIDLIAERRAAGRSTAPFYWAGFVASGDWR